MQGKNRNMGVSGEKESNRKWKSMIIYISSRLLIHLVLRPIAMAGRREDFEHHIHRHTFRLLVVKRFTSVGTAVAITHMHIKYMSDGIVLEASMRKKKSMTVEKKRQHPMSMIDKK